MQDIKSQNIKAVIKKLLKLKKLTYEEVETDLECSVPTVKRILGAEELTLTRLLQFCELLEVFLAKNQAHFAYLLKLYAGQSPKQIAEKYGLTARSTDNYLIALEKHELSRVTGR